MPRRWSFGTTGGLHFGTNLKMHGTAPESPAFVAELAGKSFPADVTRFVIPPFTSLQGLAGIRLGAQNAHHAAACANTGEISFRDAGGLGC